MKPLFASLYGEILKIRKSKILSITFAALMLIPLMGGFFMFVLKNPEFAKSTGLLGAKAQLVGEASWPSYFGLLSQAIAVGGILVFGFIFSWVFGREYSDRTYKDLLAMSISRPSIVLSKFIAASLWCVLLSLFVFGLGFVIGSIIELPNGSAEITRTGFSKFVVSALLTIVLSYPVAFFASYGRGYLAPLGFVVITLVFAQVIAAAGHGYYFPWSIPALYSQIADPESEPIGSVSYLIVFFTGLLGFTGTILWWKFADQ
ncbi:ABC transporter permease subunit [Bacillus sp. DNRA2]|uniref:ABC transporter permease n=1 Tax=Bacillus sp. DNRA2 TaxID=2723053 RepID=UPI00145E4C0A|nr:ABC transporter permease [Bacillus sp. DNRA2]NMD71725.1 ABC transporter permease subunit [Bacillus sp. DNRA2]